MKSHHKSALTTVRMLNLFRVKKV
jgi:hypothetical protein